MDKPKITGKIDVFTLIRSGLCDIAGNENDALGINCDNTSCNNCILSKTNIHKEEILQFLEGVMKCN
jgi:hypothetical protein